VFWLLVMSLFGWISYYHIEIKFRREAVVSLHEQHFRKEGTSMHESLTLYFRNSTRTMGQTACVTGALTLASAWRVIATSAVYLGAVVVLSVVLIARIYLTDLNAHLASHAPTDTLGKRG
jgi:hypothetical protein